MFWNYITCTSKMIMVVKVATTILLLTCKGVCSTDIPKGGTQYPHFIAINDTMTCVGVEHSVPFNSQVRGVNLGGWMVLEPWITPSLFYQFLGKGEGELAMDTYTFCEVLGAEEANRQLHRHVSFNKTEDVVPFKLYVGQGFETNSLGCFVCFVPSSGQHG